MTESSQHHEHVKALDGHIQQACDDTNEEASGLKDRVEKYRQILDKACNRIEELHEELASPLGATYSAVEKMAQGFRDEEQSVMDGHVNPGLDEIQSRLQQISFTDSLLERPEFELRGYQLRLDTVQDRHTRCSQLVNQFNGAIGGFSSKLRAFDRWWQSCP